MKYRGLLIAILVIFLTPIAIWADDMDLSEDDPFEMSEDDMFSDTDSVVAVETFEGEEKEEADSINRAFNEASFGVTAEVGGTGTYGFATDTAKNDTSAFGHSDTNSIVFTEDLLIDARWKYGLKLFSDVYASWTPTRDTGTDSTADIDNATVTVRELFGDFNIGWKVYFRVGKQTLKWGKGYFWNPTDLISTDRKDFNNVNARREGSTGLKMTIPFGTWLNIYSFIDATNAVEDDLSDSAYAAKVEMLLGEDTEISLSGWSKPDYKPVMGFDFSTYALDTQWRGEISASIGTNQHYLVNDNGIWRDSYDPNEWLTTDPENLNYQMSFGFTKTFDIGDINDRLMLTGEFLLNPNGYEGSDDLLRTLLAYGAIYNQSYLFPMYHGKAYAGFFVNWSKFLGSSDLSLSANTIMNFSDQSAVLATNLSYVWGYDTTLTLSLKGYSGDNAAEFTYLGNYADISLSFTSTL